MKNIMVYCKYNTELLNFDALNRGFRGDIYVRFETEFFHLNVYDLARLKQDFETESDYYGFFSIEPNVIIVKEVTIGNIKYTIERLEKQGYFNHIKSLYLEESFIDNLIEV